MPTQQHRQPRQGETPSGLYDSADAVPKGTPTPTQDELNAINLGQQPELQPDGSGPDPNNMPIEGSVIGAPMNQEERDRAHQQREREHRERTHRESQSTQAPANPQHAPARPLGTPTPR